MFAVLLLHIHRVDRFDRRRIDASLCSADQSIISRLRVRVICMHVLLLIVICVVDRMFKFNGFVETVKSLCARSLELLSDRPRVQRDAATGGTPHGLLPHDV